LTQVKTSHRRRNILHLPNMQGDCAMSDIVHTSHPSTDEKKSGMNFYVLGAVVLAMAALLAYQMFGCTGCYAPI